LDGRSGVIGCYPNERLAPEGVEVVVTPREYAAELLAGLRACVSDRPGEQEPMERLAQVAGQVPPRLLPAVDTALRQGFSEYRSDGWPHLGGHSELARFMRLPADWGVMAVAASHRSGYVREAAVWALAASNDGRAVPYVLLRLNDWVKEIRRAARSAIETFFQPVFAHNVIAALPVVWALARQNRDDHERFVSRVLAFLRSPACAPALRAGCRAQDREIRRVCFELLLRRGGGAEHEAPEALSAALADRDPVVRVWAARRLARETPAPWADVLARRALGDRSVQVRRAALAAVASMLSDEEARPLLEAALLDTHTTARWQARILVLARGPFDLAAFYHRALSTATQPAAICGALLGLGESGTVADVACVVPFLSADRARVRGAALRARAGLEPLSASEPYLAALRSPEPALSREARRALEPRVSYVAAAILRELVVDRTLPPHTRRNALALVNGKSKWEGLPALLDGCGDPDEMNASLALRLIEAWCARYNRSFLQPTPAEVEDASASFARVSPRLRAGARGEVRQILGVFRRT
jgi:HEAT repeat protein